MPNLQSLSKAAEETGVDRNTIARWVKLKKLRAVKGPPVRNLAVTLVDVEKVRELADAITRGRPRAK